MPCRRLPVVCDIVLKYKYMQQNAGTLLHMKNALLLILGQTPESRQHAVSIWATIPSETPISADQQILRFFSHLKFKSVILLNIFQKKLDKFIFMMYIYAIND